ncbi:LIC12611 family phage tail protein [Leptospira barantonii]|uniref:Phage tail tape measure protein n=1 Tax=Leptospira barantonii TaxID=2023184 RepID=A0ABX4NQK6_9LEPT|nr:hypothetical protein [Leptospira barantonii]PJZ57882.1 hypothetical protein CH367_05660 [Leptospira barantonii]
MAERDVNVKIKISVDPKDSFTLIEKDVKKLKEQVLAFSDAMTLVSQKGVKSWKALKDSVSSFASKKSELSTFTEQTKKLDSSLSGLSSKLKGMAKLPNPFSEMTKSADAAGKKVKELDSGLATNAAKTSRLSGAFSTLNTVATSVFQQIIVPSFKSGIELDKQRSILKNLAGDGYSKLQAAINNTIKTSKGLHTQTELTKITDDAIRSGYSIDFISKNLSGLQMASKLTGNELSSSMTLAFKAIESGNDDFFKHSGALFSAYSKDFQKINGSAMSEADKRIAREELIFQALNKNKTLQNSYKEEMKTASGILERFDGGMNRLSESLGTKMVESMKPLFDMLSDLIDYFTTGEDASERLQTAMILLGSVLVGVFGALAVAAWSAVAPLIPFIAAGVAIGLVIGGIILIFKNFNKILDAVKNGFMSLLTSFQNSKIGSWFGLLKASGAPPPAQTGNVTNVNDALITKHGEIVKFHPDDNVVAVKDLGVLGGSKQNRSGGGISVNIANVVLGSATRKEDASVFASYLEKELDKIALKIGLASGLTPEGA